MTVLADDLALLMAFSGYNEASLPLSSREIPSGNRPRGGPPTFLSRSDNPFKDVLYECLRVPSCAIVVA